MRIQQEDTPFSWKKSGRVSHLVYYGALAGFHACVYDARQHVHTKASQNLLMHQTH